jgi:type IV secretory pathway VirB9-like protein
MRRSVLFLLLITTALAACSTPQSSGGETVIEGPQPPRIQTVEVPVYVQESKSSPPRETLPARPRDPLAVLADVNRRSIRIPDPNDYVGTVYVVPTVPDIVYQVYMGEGQPTTIDLPPNETYRKVVIANPHLWEITDGEINVNDQGETIQTIMFRPYEGGLRNQSLIIKTNRTTHRFNLATYRGNTYHRGVRMLAPARGLSFEDSDAPPGVTPLGSEPAIPIDIGDYAYRTTGDKVDWKPSAVFSHGGKTYIELPAGDGPIRPPQIVDTSTGQDRVVNWYVSHKRYIVVPDQVLKLAELRRDGKTVVIERERE